MILKSFRRRQHSQCNGKEAQTRPWTWHTEIPNAVSDRRLIFSWIEFTSREVLTRFWDFIFLQRRQKNLALSKLAGRRHWGWPPQGGKGWQLLQGLRACHGSASLGGPVRATRLEVEGLATDRLSTAATAGRSMLQVHRQVGASTLWFAGALSLAPAALPCSLTPPTTSDRGHPLATVNFDQFHFSNPSIAFSSSDEKCYTWKSNRRRKWCHHEMRFNRQPVEIW